MPNLSNSPKKRPDMWGSHYMTSEDIELRSFASSFRRFETSYCLLRHGIKEACLLDYDPEDEGTTIVRNVGNHLAVNLLTSWSRVLPKKLISPQLVRKFPTFYGTRMFITESTTASHLSLPCARSMQSLPIHPTSWNSILILSSHLRLVLPRGPSLRFPHQNRVCTSPLPHTYYMPLPINLAVDTA
jgi:hypothetical protein